MRRILLVAWALSAITLGVYWQVVHHDFIDFDDPTYVTENVHVQQGLTLDGVIWAFTSTEPDNWHPLTWLSHMLDYQLYGLQPGWHHLSNVLLHVVNSVLLFLVLNRMTNALWKSALVAALFALHPLHVESVAWISERKDVLSTLFWFLTLGAYAGYVQRPNAARYVVLLVFFALGLLAKPMLVTLPFVLLLIDWWPLRRLPRWSSGAATRLVVEKIPLFALAAASSIWTFLVQRNGQAVIAFNDLSVKERLANALLSYTRYIAGTVWPTRLAVFYPYRYPPRAHVAAAGAALLIVSVIAVWWGRRYRYLAVGWLWYLGTLVPVIGLVQVGMQSMADRYTYVPLIGLFIILAWGIPDLMPKRSSLRLALAISGGVVISGCAVATWFQIQHWQDSITLHEHALAVTTDNYVAHHNLGAALYVQGHFQEAAVQFAEAIRIRPDFAEAVNNLGVVRYRQGRIQEAGAYFREAIQLKPDYEDALNNLTLIATRGGRVPRSP